MLSISCLSSFLPWKMTGIHERRRRNFDEFRVEKSRTTHPVLLAMGTSCFLRNAKCTPSRVSWFRVRLPFMGDYERSLEGVSEENLSGFSIENSWNTHVFCSDHLVFSGMLTHTLSRVNWFWAYPTSIYRKSWNTHIFLARITAFSQI